MRYSGLSFYADDWSVAFRFAGRVAFRLLFMKRPINEHPTSTAMFESGMLGGIWRNVATQSRLRGVGR